ncbi:obscurin [Trichonephila inaurata madagascariensis]|uniref:Obscurin n=1 Tax=Trichonephila inaurata madagascariensis TaxID=2747483 RepID=A0A8X6YM52_9ARAC|nr:obscurin [Trichonephila inaurata madagascariensis]
MESPAAGPGKKLGSKPGRPEKPVARDSSDTEIYITWAVPRDEGNCTTLGYALEFKKADEDDWKLILNNIEHEYFVIRNLEPSTFYQFRVQAYNKFGWGEHGMPTEPISTKLKVRSLYTSSDIRCFIIINVNCN